jgi:hypothetical protein
VTDDDEVWTPPDPPVVDPINAEGVFAWVAANWPKVTDHNRCRHCGEYTEGPLIAIGVGGARPHIWVHYECYEPWRVALYATALARLGLT